MVMIFNKDSNPNNSVYYIGGLLIDCVIQDPKNSTTDFFELHHRLCKRQKISIHNYILTLDWLYLLELIKTDNHGNIKKCF